MVFITEGFLEVAIESWPEWDLNPRPLNSVQIYIYTLPRRVAINTNIFIFQHELLHNVLYLNELNEMLYEFGKKVSPLCSFCMEELESPIHKNRLSLDAATKFFPKMYY